MVRLAAVVVDDKKATATLIIDVDDVLAVTDHFVITRSDQERTSAITTYQPSPQRRAAALMGMTLALEIVRGCRGLDLVGCDLVEVAPIYDTSGMTAHIAADLIYEMLCVLPGVQHRA